MHAFGICGPCSPGGGEVLADIFTLGSYVNWYVNSVLQLSFFVLHRGIPIYEWRWQDCFRHVRSRFIEVEAVTVLSHMITS